MNQTWYYIVLFLLLVTLLALLLFYILYVPTFQNISFEKSITVNGENATLQFQGSAPETYALTHSQIMDPLTAYLQTTHTDIDYVLTRKAAEELIKKVPTLNHWYGYRVELKYDSVRNKSHTIYQKGVVYLVPAL